MRPRNLRQGWCRQVLPTILGLMMIVLIPAVSMAMDLEVDDSLDNSPYTVSGDISYQYERIGINSQGVLNHYSGTNTVYNLSLGLDYKSYGEYNLVYGSLSVINREQIGEYGIGHFTQWGGTNSVSDDLFLGAYSSGKGTYELIAGNISSQALLIGFRGHGQFIQTGGTNTVTGYLELSVYNTANGTYDLSGTGSLSASNEYIGQRGNGVFTQSGGNHSVTGAEGIYVGYYSDSRGTYNQSGGTLSVTNDVVLAVEAGSNGIYNLEGGTLSAGNIEVRSGGTFNQTGGSWESTFYLNGGTVTGTLEVLPTSTFNYNSGTFEGDLVNQGTTNLNADFTVGNGFTFSQENGTCAASGNLLLDGTYTQNGGINTVTGTLSLAANPGSIGTYNLEDGSLNAGTITVNPGGFFNNTGGSLSFNTFNQNGGTVTGSLEVLPTSTFNYNSGTFAADLANQGKTYFTIDFTVGNGMTFSQESGTSTASANLNLGDALGNGTVAHTGGTISITNGLLLGQHATSTGTYTLSGSGNLSAKNQFIGYEGTGVFHQISGTNSLTYDLFVGYSGDGHSTYNLSDGTLSTRNTGVGQFTTGSGSFNQTGGNHYINYNLRVGNLGMGSYYQSGGGAWVGDDLFVGNTIDGTGTYELSGTGHLSADNEYIGNFGTGNFIQSTVNSNYLYKNLFLGYEADSSGTYELSNGELSALSLSIGRLGTGSFGQKGGTVEARLNFYVGGESGGVGSYQQTGGTNSVATNLYIGTMSGASGTYELSGTGGLWAGNQFIGYKGTGQLTQTGGTSYAAQDFYLGYDPYSIGSYTLGGTSSLESQWAYIGNRGTGFFTQEGGTNTITVNLYLGHESSGSGSYNLSQGSLVAPDQYIGYEGTGIFNQSGGTNLLSSDGITVNGNLWLGYYGGKGNYNLGGGTLSADQIYMGGESIFNQTGGTLQYNDFFQDGGEVKGALENRGTYNYSSGIFSGRLLNHGSVNLGTDFTAGDGLLQASATTLDFTSGQNLTFNGQGLTNEGNITLAGTLQASQEIIGDSGTGTLTQTDGSNTVTGALNLAAHPGSSGTYNLQGGSLSAGEITINTGGLFTKTGGNLSYDTFNLMGGTVTGTLENQTGSIFTINSGAINGSLENWGNLLLTGGTLAVNNPIVNQSVMEGSGTLTGSGGFINEGSFAQVGGNLTLSTMGSNENNNTMELAAGQQLKLDGAAVTLTNAGSLNLNNAFVVGTGTLDNIFGGTIFGKGTISSYFQNSDGGVLALEGGALKIAQDFTNSGFIQLNSYTANLSGGALTNTGTIEGHGTVRNNITNTGIIEPLGSTLTLTGAVTNPLGGLLAASTGNKLILAQGLAADNAGVISLAGGTIDTNDQPLGNARQITGYGILRTGGLSNTGTITLTGGTTTVNGDVTNEAGGELIISYNPVIFTGEVVNYGTVKTTSTTVTWAGDYDEHGTYECDPATNKFNNLTVWETGRLIGYPGDVWEISGNFENYSAMNELWSTGQCDLAFTNGAAAEHALYLPGEDRGPTMDGYNNNFAWGNLLLGEIDGDGNIIPGTEQTVRLFDSNDTPGGALYVGTILGLAFDPEDPLQITNIYGAAGLNIYYDPTLNDLGGLTYDFLEGGNLIASPVPGSVLLLGTGLLGMGLLGWRRKRG